ncbi:MAG: ester cyclase [Pseudomonadota bacterium]
MSADINQTNKRAVWSLYNAIDHADDASLLAACRDYFHDDAPWFGPSPIDRVDGPDALVEQVFRPLRAAFSGLSRDTFILMGGPSNGRVDGKGDGAMWVGTTGVFRGEFVSPYLDIPPTGEAASLRFGEFMRFQDDRIVESYVIFDLLDLMEQAGVRVLPPSLGKPFIYPPPAAADGILLEQQDTEITAYSMDHTRRFIFAALNGYDEKDLTSMGMADYFHPDIAWYGPGGIGACLSFKDFQSQHQGPWLRAFPDRRVQNLTALIAEGVYSGGPGWAGVKGHHLGEFRGVPASNAALDINGLDFWKRDGEQYVENWVFVDMVHLFSQMGVDLMQQMRTAIITR